MSLRYQLTRSADGRLEMTEVKSNPGSSCSEQSNDDFFQLRTLSPPKKKFEKLDKFCLFCKKAGFKYDDHFMKKDGSNTGEIVCERIKNSTCTTCGQKGHTKSYCENKYIFTFKKEKEKEKKKVGCQYCIDNNIPNRIASTHNSYDDDESPFKKITCPLLYFHNFDLEISREDVKESIILPKKSEEPNFVSKKRFSQEILSSSQESNASTTVEFYEMEYTLQIEEE